MGMGRGRGGARWVADFVGTPGVIAALPSGLVFARAAGTAWGQGSASTLFSATLNQPRRIYTSAGNGLLLSRSTTNLIKGSATPNNSSTNGWSAGGGSSVTTPGITGPDGTASGSGTVISSGDIGPWQSTAALSALPFTLSAWLLRGGSVDSPHHGNAFGSPIVGTAQTATATWTPWSASSTGGATTWGFPWEGRALGGLTASALDTTLAFIMMEATGYRRMPVVTASGATGTIAGDVLSHSTAATMMSGGRLSLRVRFVPQGASSQLVADGLLWWVDASNYCKIVAATRNIAVTVAGSTYTTSGVANWAAYDVVDLFVSAGGGALNSTVTLSVNGGAVQSLGTSGAPQGTIPSGGAIYFGCASDATGQFDAIFQRIEAF